MKSLLYSIYLLATMIYNIIVIVQTEMFIDYDF